MVLSFLNLCVTETFCFIWSPYKTLLYWIFSKALPPNMLKVILVIVCAVLIGAEDNCIFKNWSMLLPRAMRRLDLSKIFTWKLLLYSVLFICCKITKKHPLDIWDCEIIFNFMQFCVGFGHFNLVLVTKIFCFTLGLIQRNYIAFFFPKKWPSDLLKTILVIVYKTLIDIAIIIFIILCLERFRCSIMRFRWNSVTNCIFNTHFFVKYPLILKNGPTWSPGSFKFDSGYFLN